MDTDFITRHFDELFPAKGQAIKPSSEETCFAAMALVLGDQDKPTTLKQMKDSRSPFSTEANARSNHFLTKKVQLKFGQTELEATVVSMGNNRYKVQLQEGIILDVSARLNKVSILIDMSAIFFDTIH